MKNQRKTRSTNFKPVKVCELVDKLQSLPVNSEIRLTGYLMNDVFLDRPLNRNLLTVYYDEMSNDTIIHIG